MRGLRCCLSRPLVHRPVKARCLVLLREAAELLTQRDPARRLATDVRTGPAPARLTPVNGLMMGREAGRRKSCDWAGRPGGRLAGDR